MKYFFSILLVLIVIVLFGCIFIYQGIYLPKEPDSTEMAIFLVKKGEGAKEISNNLKEQGLIRWSSLFRVYVLIKGVSKDLKAGQYSFSKAMPMPEIVDKLVAGEIIKKTITVIEGWNLRDIGWYFENQGIFTSEELFELVGFPMVDYSRVTDMPKPKDFSQEFDFLKDKPKNVGLEGYLFPDTYEISPEDGIDDIVRKMLTNFGKKLNQDLRDEVISQGKSIFEIVTMASLIEKEVRSFEDKKIVSGIFWKKINRAEPLYSCATIAYILGRENWTFEEMRREIGKGAEIDSPYNTYKYLGLPLGPICNPGLESILAALNPQDSEFWYYLSTPESETIFSRTLEEHNIAKAKYLK